MKKTFQILVLVLCAVLAMPFVTGCKPPVVEDGVITFTRQGQLKNGNIRIAYSDNVKAEGVSSITYEIKEGSTPLPTGLTMNSEGTISGTPTAETPQPVTFTVIAKAIGADPVEAVCSIKIGGIVFANSYPVEGQVGLGLGLEIKALNNLQNIKYSLDASSQPLPAGLSLGEDGYLEGTPAEPCYEYKCVVAAEATGVTPGKVDLIFYIAQSSGQIYGPGTITGFNGRTLPGANVNSPYSASVKPAIGLSATNEAPVTFVTGGTGSVPPGFTLNTNGDLRSSGNVSTSALIDGKVTEYNFTIIAKAENCPDVEVDFKLTVDFEKISALAGKDIGTAYTGQTFDFDIGSVIEDRETKYNGVIFAFAVADPGNYPLPAGFSLNTASGMITGAAEKSVKVYSFLINITASNYARHRVELTIRIRDSIEVNANGIFNAEWMDLKGIQGAGDSNNPEEEGLIQRAADEGLTTSSGYFVGYTNAEITFHYTIYSSIEVNNVSMSLSLNSENKAKLFTSSSFIIRVNNRSLTYNNFTVPGGGDAQWGSFAVHNISGSGSTFTLVAGENVIELIITADFLNYGTKYGGPAIDYMRLLNYGSATLRWAPHKYNTDHLPLD